MSNTITSFFKGRVGVAEAVYQNDYGIVMNFDSIELPAHFDCYFSTTEGDEAIPGIGADRQVVIPNECLSRPGNVVLHIPVHTGANDSEVEYVVYFKVIGRARPMDDGTPVQMTAIEQALALLQNPIGNIEQIVNEALSFTGDTFAEMQAKLDEDQAEFQTEIRGDIADVESDFDNLNAQYQTAVAAHTVDSEVQNVRVGADGVTYASAGESVRTQFTNLTSDINSFVGNSRIPVTENGKLINLSGSTADISSPTTSGSGFRYSLVECNGGDVFIVSAVGGSGARAWGFIDSSGNILSKADADITVNNTTLIAPQNSAYLIINDKGGLTSYTGQFLVDQVADNTNNIDGIASGVMDILASKELLVDNYINCFDFTVADKSAWKLEKSFDYIKVTHLSSGLAGYPQLTVTLESGNYTFHANFTNANKKTIDLYTVGGTYIRGLIDGSSISVSETTTYVFVYNPATQNVENVVTDISLQMTGAISGLDALRNKQNFSISGTSTPIKIDGFRRVIIFPKNLDIVLNGVNYCIRQDAPFEYDYSSTGTYVLKTVYFDTSMLPTVVENGLSNDCFYSRSDTATTALDKKYVLIATIPDSYFYHNAKPSAIFDYVTNYGVNYSAILAKGFVNNIPAVKPLKGSDALFDADAYDQFENIIALWDSLLTRANQYGTYMQKCWIDGTAYDDSNHIMSDAPTAGEHNPRADMNQYPLIMYKLIPAKYSDSYYHKPVTKKILIVSGIHGASSGGDNLESPAAIYYFAKRLVEAFYDSDSLINIRNNYEVDFIPIANPWGINNKQRYNGQNVDINRDYGDYYSVTSQQIKALIDSGEYNFAMDSHCLGGTSLVSGDLADANFHFVTGIYFLKALGFQITNYIGAKYSLKVDNGDGNSNTMTWYCRQSNVLGITTEIPANTPLYYGDTIGDVHGAEVMRRDVDYIQNVIAVICDAIKDTTY